VNGHDYTLGYYLANGIYPSWATFVKTIQDLKIKKQAEFSKAQEACRRILKELLVLCKLGLPLFVVQLVFGTRSLINIMTACVILHNMIIKDERDLSLKFFFDNVGSRVRPERNPGRIHAFLETYRQIEDSTLHLS
jgi:hypothetical protein